jgi:dipeptide transport system substrate-binding protein
MRLKAGRLCAAGLIALCVGSVPAMAKTLVYCSEGSPENFTPAINTTGTSFDAARPVHDQLVIFERGTTKVVPGLAESWTVSDGGKTITSVAQRREVPLQRYFQTDPGFQRDDVI